MRTYLRLFFNLLMPISVIITIVSVAYFSVSYDFSKAMKLGVLSGVLLGLGITVFAALFLLVTRKSVKPVQESVNVPDQTKQKNKNVPTNTKKSAEQKLMLLMDKKLAFEVALYAVTDQGIGDVRAKESKEVCTIKVKTEDETLQINVTPLTRHTSQIILQAERNSQATDKIISYIKGKEHSFLQY